MVQYLPLKVIEAPPELGRAGGFFSGKPVPSRLLDILDTLVL